MGAEGRDDACSSPCANFGLAPTAAAGASMVCARGQGITTGLADFSSAARAAPCL